MPRRLFLFNRHFAREQEVADFKTAHFRYASRNRYFSRPYDDRVAVGVKADIEELADYANGPGEVETVTFLQAEHILVAAGSHVY